LGTKAVNLSIGLRRAEAAKAYLVAKGVAAERIRTASKGETEPLVPNTSEENRRKNRRVVMKIVNNE
jgi:outer membrane protein OmpA-like peptidoglycan-associated protein